MTWRRIRHGNGHRYVDDAGEPVPGVTGIIGNGVPKPALVDWAARETAGYTLDHWAELAAMTSSSRLRAMERGRFERQKAATVRGTLVHDYAAQLAGGAEVDVPEEYLGYVDSYLRFVADWRVDDLAVEAPVFNLTHRYAGTIDLLATIDGGALWLIDWKTGSGGIYGETALQLSAYAHAERILIGGAEQAMPAVEQAVAVWLRADGYDVHPVDISEGTYYAFLYAQQVARWRDQPREASVGAALRSPFVQAAAS